jgi:hypothetical protein
VTCRANGCKRKFRAAYKRTDGTVYVVRPSGLCPACWASKHLRERTPCRLCGGKRERFTGLCAACCFPAAADNGDVA